MNQMTTELRARKARPRVRAGRPTKAQTEIRHQQLLDSALDHFLEKGYERATIEAIADSVSMTKRTVYARYPDKAALFLASVRRAIERIATSPESLRAVVGDDLPQTLEAIARLRVEQLMTPEGLKLQRVINTESYRFPEIFRLSYENGALPGIRFLAQLLREETEAGRLALDDPDMAANLFWTMVVSAHARLIVSGEVPPSEEISRRIRAGVRLFLNGALPR